MDERFTDHLRLDPAQTSKLFCRLDADPDVKPGKCRRRHPRFDYRVSGVAVTVTHPAGSESRFLAQARNLSAGGIGFLHGGYLHPGSDCKLGLIKDDGTMLWVTGKVRHCRHLKGTCHEVGILFDQELDTGLVAALPGAKAPVDDGTSAETVALEGAVLLADPLDTDRKLLEHNLAATGLTVKAVDTYGAASDALHRRKYDIVLCGMRRGDAEGARAVARMRDIGFRGPIIVMAAEASAEELGHLHMAGANEVIGKPTHPSFVMELMAEWMDAPTIDDPIYSRLEAEPGMAELIADFINQMQRTAHDLEKSMLAEDAVHIRELCVQVAGSGSGYGFDQLSVAAQAAIHGLDSGDGIAGADTALRRVTSLCGRLRCSRTTRPLQWSAGHSSKAS